MVIGGQPFEYFVVLDFEATCDRPQAPVPQEIIEFPSVLLSGRTFEVIDEFRSFVRPKFNPQLSPFCTELTGITQAMVDVDGVGFPDAFAAFMDFFGPEPVQFASFGGDEKIIEINCGFYGLPMPSVFWIKRS